MAQSAPAQQFPANDMTPMVRVGKTIAAPTIDGKLEDAAWRRNITVSDFSLNGGKQPALEQTQVKFAYDAQNLYVAWRCQESLLTVAQQRVHEVHTNAKVHDADVFSDDSVLLFVHPASGSAVYEFNVNSIGTHFDARSLYDDLWGARDAAWDAGAQSAGIQEDGFWTAELAIPWKSLGLSAPPALETAWEVGLARRAVGRGESSAWNQSESPSFHLISQWGQLVFADAVPAITSQLPGNFEAGKSTLEVQIAPPGTSAQIEIGATVTEGNKIQKFQGGGAYEKPAAIKVPIAATSDTPLLRWNATGASGKILYRSPQLALAAQSTRARLKISTEKPWKLFVNRVQVGAGNAAQNHEATFPLIAGANDIVVETQSGVAQLELIPPGVANEEIAWRMYAAGDAGALATANRQSWKIAPQQNGIVGIAGTPAFLQHTLLWKSTPRYPLTDPAFYIAEGTAQQITFIAEGVKDIRFDQWQLTLAVPPTFEVIGSSGFYGNQIAGKAKFRTVRVGETMLGGEKMVLYHIISDQPITYKANQNLLLTSFEVLVRMAKNSRQDAAREWQFHYWTRGNGNTIGEASQSFLVRTLGPVNGKQPKKLVWEFWAHATHVYDDRDLLREILDTSRQVGFNKYLASSWKEFNDVVRSYGMKTFALTGFKDGRTFDIVRPYLVAHPDEKLVDKTGKPQSDYMCTTKLLGENWPMFAQSIQKWMLAADLDAVEYDYEYPPFNPPHACFCERCLQEFRSFARFEEKLALSPAIVQEKYSPQWVNFMAYRTAILLGKMKAAVHEANPKVLFTVYSGYYDAKENSTKSRYGIDWDLVGKMQVVDEAGMGYGRPVPAITDSIAALRGVPVKFGQLLVPYDMRSTRTVAPLTRATLLRRALDATGGVLIYQRNAMDGRSWHAVAETTRLVADFEELFLAHKLAGIPGQDSSKVQLLQGENQSLLCVMNETSKPAQFNFRLPVELGAGREYYSGKNVVAGGEVEITLGPGEAAAYVLK